MRKYNTCEGVDPVPGILFCKFKINVLHPCGSADKESACNEGDLVLIPGLGRSPGEGTGYTPVFWPGEFHGLFSPWDRKESDMTEQLSLSVLLLTNSLISTDFILREPWKVGNITVPPVKSSLTGGNLHWENLRWDLGRWSYLLEGA